MYTLIVWAIEFLSLFAFGYFVYMFISYRRKSKKARSKTLRNHFKSVASFMLIPAMLSFLIAVLAFILNTIVS